MARSIPGEGQEIFGRREQIVTSKISLGSPLEMNFQARGGSELREGRKGFPCKFTRNRKSFPEVTPGEGGRT